jgi:response regulator RpfG family c-di-GMP phosphodiesterase
MYVVSLEEQVKAALSRLGVKPMHQEVMFGFLDQLKHHARNMYAHSLRVGLYAEDILRKEGGGERLALMGGCMHDIGKCSSRKELLSGRDITLEEYEEIKNHAYEGFLMLKKDLPMTAMVAGMHHWRDGRGYGATLDDLPFHVGSWTKGKLVEVVRDVAIADYFDAVQTRKNKFGLDKNDPMSIANALSGEFDLILPLTAYKTSKLYAMREKLAARPAV